MCYKQGGIDRRIRFQQDIRPRCNRSKMAFRVARTSPNDRISGDGLTGCGSGDKKDCGITGAACGKSGGGGSGWRVGG